MEQVTPLPLDRPEHWLEAMDRLGCDIEAWDRIRQRRDVMALMTGPVKSPAASILKQAMLAAGADALVHRLVLTCGVPETRVLVYGTGKCLKAGCESLKGQPFALGELAEVISRLVEVPDPPALIHVGGSSLDFGPRPLFMGVLNCTPDSFSDGGLWSTPETAVEHAVEMQRQGASVIDVGGESTRPGSSPASPGEQLSRVVPVILGIRRLSDVPISIDTTLPEVAEAALDAGAGIINSVDGMETPGMPELARDSEAAVVLMHMRGTPMDMQEHPEYTDAPGEVAEYLLKRIGVLEKAGVDRSRIMVDPGIGFGKRPWDNLRLIQTVPWLRRITGCRVVLGHSRKSFLGLVTGEPDPLRRDSATALVSALSADRADILRVHDVKQSAIAVSAVLKGARR
jgi:dihydropteroate synthase